MSSFAELVLEAQTRSLKAAEGDLGRLTKASAKTDKAVSQHSASMGSAVTKFGGAATKALAGAAAAFLSFQTAALSVNAAKAFNASLAETSTLLNGGKKQMDALSKSALKLAGDFGGGATPQVKAFYQAISAGAGTVKEATKLLGDANKLSIGGITGVTTAVDALTTATNAYRSKALTSTQASDAMFVAMKGGKTTIGELSKNLGNIVPIASAAGVSFDEVTAGIAALTTQGLSTAAATTGLRQILASIIAPTETATAAATDLSFAFDVQSLKAKGLATFMNELVAATGGNEAEMAKLFGSVEALGAALSFAGGAGGKFTEIMVDMDDKAGATEAAYRLIAESLSKQLDKALDDVGLQFLRMGNFLLPKVTAAAQNFAGALAFVGDNVDALVIAMGALTLRALPLMVTGLASSVAWLGTFEGAMAFAQVQAVLLGGALKAIPFLAAVGAATALYRFYSTEKETVRALRESHEALNKVLGEYIETKSPEAAQATLEQADKYEVLARAALLAAEATMLQGGMGKTGWAADFQGDVDRAREALDDVLATIKAVKLSAANTGDILGTVLDPTVVAATAAALTELDAATSTLTSGALSSSVAQVAGGFSWLATEIEVAVTAQRKLEQFQGQQAILDTVEAAKALNWALIDNVDQTAEMSKLLGNIETAGTFDKQATAISTALSYLDAMIGNLDEADGASIALYSALQQALSSAIGLAEADIASGVWEAATAAEQFARNMAAANGQIAGIGRSKAMTAARASTVGDPVARAGAEAVADFRYNKGTDGGYADISSGNGAERIAEMEASIRSAAEQAKAASIAVSEADAAFAKLSKTSTGTASSLSEAAKSTNVLAKQIEKLEFDHDPAKKFNAEIAKLDRLLGAGLSPEAYATAMGKLNDEFASGVPAIDDLIGAFSNFIQNGLDDFEGFTKTIANNFKALLSDMITTAARNKIVISMTGAASGLGGGLAAAAGQAGAPAGGVDALSLLSTGSSLLGGGGGIGGGLLGAFGTGQGIAGLAGGSGFLGGLGGVVGGFASGGIGGAVTGGLSAITGATTALGGLAAAAGAIVPVLGAVALAVSFFKTKTKNLSSGLKVQLDGMDARVRTFSTDEKSKYWGMKKSTKTKYSSASSKVADPLQDAFNEIGFEVMGFADTLGLQAKAVQDVNYSFRLRTSRRDPDEVQERLLHHFTEFGDEAVKAIVGMTAETEAAFKSFQREGESAYVALSRMVAAISPVNTVLDLLAHTMFDVSVAGAGMAADLAESFGGLEAFNAATTNYYTAFYTDAEKFANLSRKTADALGTLNIAMPRSRLQYREMIEALDLTTRSGRDSYAALVSLSGAFDQLLPKVGDLTIDLAGLLNSTSSAVSSMIAETESSQRASEQAAALWYRTAKTLKDFIADMRGTASALVSPQGARGFNEARFQTLLASALSGDNQAATDITRAARLLLTSTQATAKTRVEAARSEARVLSDLSLLGGVSDIEGARHDVIASLLGNQVDLLKEVRDYLSSGGRLDPDQISSLDAQLGSLTDAIAAAEMINYAFLRQRLDVTVDLLTTAHLPSDVRALLANAQSGIRGQIDFVVRSNLTPDQKWLALTASSEHIKALDFVLGNTPGTLAAQTALLALESVNAINRTINLIIGQTLTPDEMQVALTGSSEVSRTINVILASGASQAAMDLALGNVKLYQVTVGAALASNLDPDVKRVLVSQQGTYAAVIEAAFSSTLTPEQRRVLLLQQGKYIATIYSAISATVTAPEKILLLNSLSAGVRAVTIVAVFGKNMTPEQRALLVARSAAITKTIWGKVGFANMTSDKWDLLRQNTQSLTKTILGAVDLSTLGPKQLALLNAITGASAGMINLGGSFTFDPSNSFSVWFGTTIKDRITTPMNLLRTSLNVLASAVRAETALAIADRKAAAAEQARQEKVLGLQSQLLASVNTQTAAIQTSNNVVSQIKSLERTTGVDIRDGKKDATLAVNASGKIDYAATHVNYGKGDDLAGFKSAFWSPGGLQSQIGAANGSAVKAQAAINQLRAQITNSGGVPAYAKGTDYHPGGMALVGEEGPEYVDLPRGSSVSTASETRNLMDTDSIVEAIKKLQTTLKTIQEQNRQFGLRADKANQTVAKLMERWEAIGMPLERAQ